MQKRQESELITAFRGMSASDRNMLLMLAKDRAAHHHEYRAPLKLVAGTGAALSSGSLFSIDGRRKNK